MKLSLRAKFLILSGLAQALVVCLLIWNSLRLLDHAITENAYRVAREYAVTLNLSLSHHASTGRLAELQPFLGEMLASPRDSFVRYLLILDADGHAIFHVGAAPANLATIFTRADRNATVNGLTTHAERAILHASAPFLLRGGEVGALKFGLSTEDLRLARSEVLNQSIAISTIGFAVGLVLLFIFTYGIGRRLSALTGQSQRLSRGQFGDLLPEHGGDEIEVFARSLNRMSLTLAERIAQLETSEKHLAESEARFKTLFNMAPVPLTVTNQAGTLLGVNLALARVFGREQADVLGKTTADINFWQSFEERERIWSLLRKNGAMQGDIATARLSDGRLIELAIWSSSFAINGEQSIIWALLDMSAELQAKRALTELNASLEERVQQRASELERANLELFHTLESLKQTQQDLITAEKMASLGSLVAGVAHELNTPIGNSLLMASTLADQVAEFSKAMNEVGIKRSTLMDHLGNTATACALMVGALQKAANLIASFKQVAVDQANDRRRIFDLRVVLQDTLATFAPRLNRTHCGAVLDAADNLMLDSYPGSLCQVIDNLINNALIHAFDGIAAAKIEIRAYALNAEWVEMTFKDNGNGMPPATLRHVFDPFFTTKMGQGGTGLGMSIVYNIVTGVLGGRIVISSDLGDGTLLRISLPKIAPLHEESAAPSWPNPPV